MAESLDGTQRFLRGAAQNIVSRETSNNPLDSEADAAARAVDQLLQNESDYGGAVPFGSVMIGADAQQSDLDVVAFRESRQFADQRIKEISSHELSDAATKILKSQNITRRAHCINYFVTEDTIREDIRTYSGYFAETELWLRIFSPAAIGKKIDQYRAVVSEEIRGLTHEQQIDIAESMAAALVRAEARSFYKIVMRTNLKKTVGDMFAARLQTWNRGIQDILGVEPVKI